MDNVSLANKDHRHSARKSKVKRLTDDTKQKKLLSHSPVLHIPQMSEKSLKRWCEARDTYLGQEYPYTQKPRRIKRMDKPRKQKERTSFFTLDSSRFSRKEFQQPQPIQIDYDHFEDKCIETEINEEVLFKADVEHVDEGNQVDLPSPKPELVENEEKQQIQFDQESIQHSDKATETDLILSIENDNETVHQNTEETIVDSIPNVNDQIKPLNESAVDKNDDDTKTILSSTKSNNSIYEQLQRLRIRFKRLSKERRLLSCLLLLYFLIMWGLLVVIFMLLWSFIGRSSVLYRDAPMINTGIIDGVARYGESCNKDIDCKRPFTCFKKKSSSSSGVCRCPLQYDFANNQCIGDLNALCTKDTNCQRYMLCSGMEDGTRRCQCQTLYNYDTERKQCRGDYHALCHSTIDCQANLICNKTITPSLCLCQTNYRYYPLVRKCRGDPGAICEQATAECADNAECRDGVCECAFQFVPNKNKICVDPCPKIALNRVKIRYPGNCRRFIDCQQRSKYECPEMTIFNFRTQLCDYPKNVLDCR